MMKYRVVSSINDSSNIENNIVEEIGDVIEHEGKQKVFFFSVKVLY